MASEVFDRGLGAEDAATRVAEAFDHISLNDVFDLTKDRVFASGTQAMAAGTFIAGFSSIATASSSVAGGRPSFWVSCRSIRDMRLIVSTTCAGTRMVRPWSASARVTDWRIHQVAYVEKRWPSRQS